MGLFSARPPERDEMPFFEHLDALRPRLLRSAAVLLLFTVAAFFAGEQLMYVITWPQSASFPANRLFARLADILSSDVLRINSRPIELINTAMAGQFNLHLSISFHAALILSLPYMLFEMWGFIRPALTESELRAGRMAVLSIAACFFTGILFGYFVLVPLSVDFLSGHIVSSSITNMIDIASYMSLVLNLTLACGVVFLLPVMVSFLTRMGLLHASFMRRCRRHALLLLSVAAAIITPPDIASMILVMLPLYALYELSIRISTHIETSRQRN